MNKSSKLYPLSLTLFALLIFAFILGRIPGSPYQPKNILPLDQLFTSQDTINGLGAETSPLQNSGTQENFSRPPAGVSESAEPIGAPSVTPPPGGAYSFLKTNPDLTPVTFSPCRAIHYVMRARNAPSNGDQYIESAMADVSAATGLVFVYDGLTDENPDPNRPAYIPELYGEKWAPVLFAWIDPQEAQQYDLDQIGEATNQILTRENGFGHIVSGQITIDIEAIREIGSNYGSEAILGAIRHELAHLVGLGHVDVPTELMYPSTQPDLTNFQVGDLNGLYRLGQGRCAPDL